VDIDASIRHVLDWANDKLEAQQEPPWARPVYEQLTEALAAIQDGREATTLLEDSQQLPLQLDDDRLLAENIYPLDIARLRRGTVKLQMPM